jgi:hypothetical protein
MILKDTGLSPYNNRAVRMRALEQNHDFHAQNGWIEGVDFLRKSTLGSHGFGYTYRGFAIAPEGDSLAQLAFSQGLKPNIYCFSIGTTKVVPLQSSRMTKQF